MFHKHNWKILNWRYNRLGAFFAENTMYCFCGKTKSVEYIQNFRIIGLTEKEFLDLNGKKLTNKTK